MLEVIAYVGGCRPEIPAVTKLAMRGAQVTACKYVERRQEWK